MGGTIEWRLIPRDENGNIGPLCTPWLEANGKINVTLRHALESDRRKSGNRFGVGFNCPENPNANLYVLPANVLVMSPCACNRLQKRLVDTVAQFWRLRSKDDPRAIRELLRLQEAIVDYECRDWREIKARYWDSKQARLLNPPDPQLINFAIPMRRHIFPGLLAPGIIYLKK